MHINRDREISPLEQISESKMYSVLYKSRLEPDNHLHSRACSAKYLSTNFNQALGSSCYIIVDSGDRSWFEPQLDDPDVIDLHSNMSSTEAFLLWFK